MIMKKKVTVIFPLTVRPHHQREHAANHHDHKVNTVWCVYVHYCVFFKAHTPKRSPLPPEPSPITPLGDGHPIKQGEDDDNGACNVCYIIVGANKATEGKEISNVAMENATMASEASVNDSGTGKGAPAPKDSGERLC